MPASDNIVFACMETTEDDISLLLDRCFHPALWQAGPREVQPLYAIVNAHQLTLEVQDALVIKLRSYRTEYPTAPSRLAILLDPYEASAVLTSIGRPEVVPTLTTEGVKVRRRCGGACVGANTASCRAGRQLTWLRAWHQMVLNKHLPHVEAHESAASGQGKSTAIQKACKRTGRPLHRVLIGGPFKRSTMVRLLEGAINADPAPAVHLDVHECSGEILDVVLFELLVVGRLYDPKSQRTAFLNPGSPVFVEIANVLDNR